MKINRDASCLLLIDYQTGFDQSDYWGPRNNPLAEANAASVLQDWRKSALPVLHIRHNSKNPDSPLHPLQPGNEALAFARAMEGERVLTKTVNSAFIGTDLETILRARKMQQLVIMGISTVHCVSTTTRMAGNLGFDVLLVGDACYTFNRTDLYGEIIPADTAHRIELAILHGEFAEVVSARNISEALLDF